MTAGYPLEQVRHASLNSVFDHDEHAIPLRNIEPSLIVIERKRRHNQS